MNTTVKALLDLYVKLGGALTDTYADIADGAEVGNYTTIPDCIEACTQKAGSGGGGGGGGSGIEVVAKPSDLPSSASDGSVMVALNDDTTQGALKFDTPVTQETDVEIGAVELTLGAPDYSSDGISGVIANQQSSEDFRVYLSDDPDAARLLFETLPVVSDISDNAYVTGGLTLEAEECFVASGSTQLYCIVLDFTKKDFALLNENKVIPYGEDTVLVPYFGYFSFENVTGTLYDVVPATFEKGWNVLFAICDAQDWRTDDHPSGWSVFNAVNINDYLVYETTAATKTTLSNTAQAEIFSGLLQVPVASTPKGLYVKLSGNWTHCAND